MKIKLLLLLFSIMSISACAIEQLAPDAPLPDPFDDSIERIFACKIDGDSWKAGGQWQFYGTPYYWSYDINSGYYDANCNFYKEDSGEGFNIRSTFRDTGTYELSYASYYEWFENDSLFCGDYKLDTLAPQNLHIVRLDSLHKPGAIIGFFDFDLVGKCGDTIRITDGRFKFTYKR